MGRNRYWSKNSKYWINKKLLEEEVGGVIVSTDAEYTFTITEKISIIATFEP